MNFYYFITETANVFSSKTVTANGSDYDHPLNAIARAIVDYESISNSSSPVLLGCKIMPQLSHHSYLRVGKYKVHTKFTGSIWHEHGLGKCWELNCKLIDEDNISNELTFEGVEFTNSFGRSSVVESIAKFFNKLQQFESIEDYKKYESIEASKVNSESQDVIFQIGEVINLYAKYSAINPALPISKKLQTWIESQLTKIIKSN